MYLLKPLELGHTVSEIVEGNIVMSLREDDEFSLPHDNGNPFQFGSPLLPQFSSTQSDVTLGQLDNYYISGLDGGVTYTSSSELGELSTNLETLENDINTIKDGVTFAKEIVENIETALNIFGKIEKHPQRCV